MISTPLFYKQHLRWPIKIVKCGGRYLKTENTDIYVV